MSPAWESSSRRSWAKHQWRQPPGVSPIWIESPLPAQEIANMRSSSAGRLAQIVDARTPIVEPLAIVAISSLLTAWDMQPFVGHALVQQGSVAQGAAQAALWLAGVLAPVMALAKASMAALVCWSGAVYLGERLSLVKLISLFCVAETISALRDLTMLSVLAVRGIDSVRTTADL